MIPDCFRIPEQSKLYELILETIVLNLKVENNHLVLNLSEKEFLNLEISQPYYDLLGHNLKEANRFTDSLKIKGMDSI